MAPIVLTVITATNNAGDLFLKRQSGINSEAE
jgi:hypothetical protein